jgi:hypothetical protein
MQREGHNSLYTLFSPKLPSWIYPSPLWKINRVKGGQKNSEKMQAIPRSEDGELRRT